MTTDTPTSDTDSSAAIIKVAVMAVGGQGGGMLTNWIAELANRAGYSVQMTSVAGVAQRTGATIYYVEMAPPTSQPPVFALSPSPGDVDILIAAELMEAGRAIIRGFVTSDKTTLIASSHRVLAVSEKQVPGDGRSDAEVVIRRFESAALKSICFDMQRIADDAGTMISASLFGALAKSGALPFDQNLYEEVLNASGRGAQQSTTAFRAALAYSESPSVQVKPRAIVPRAIGPQSMVDQWDTLIQRAQRLPGPAQQMVLAGLRKTVDYLDIDYGKEYLDHVEIFVNRDSAEHDYQLSITAAKYIANAMCYDDILRVADLKTRSSRDERLRAEQQTTQDDIVKVTEYFHPRATEVCATLPSRVGAWIERKQTVFNLLQRLINKGRRVRTDGITGFVGLWLVAGLRPHRRKLLRHQNESKHLHQLILNAQSAIDTDYALAIELLACQRLIKGYSDTHSRGQSKFERVTAAEKTLRVRTDAAHWIRRLRNAAMEDENGDVLDELLNEVRAL